MPYHLQQSYIPRVEEALSRLTVDVLKTLAGLVPGPKLPTLKADLIAYITPHLQGEGLKQLWDQCDPLQKATIAEVVHSDDNNYKELRFVSKYGRNATWGTGDPEYSYRYKPSILGLFFYHFTMPEDLKARLKVFVPPPEPIKIDSQTTLITHISRKVETFNRESRTKATRIIDIPLNHCQTEALAFRDVKAVLRVVDLGKAAISEKTLFPTASTLDAIAEILDQGDYYSESIEAKTHESRREAYEVGHIKPFAWIMLLQAGKFVDLSGKKLVLSKAGQKALAEPGEKVLQTLWKSWQKSTLLDELRRVDSIKGQTGKAQRQFTAIAGRRATIVAALKECPVGEWIHVREFTRYMVGAGYDFKVSRNPENLKMESSGNFDSYSYVKGSYYHILEGRYLLCFLFEYVATLGLIDIAFVHPEDNEFNPQKGYFTGETTLSRYDGLTYFRITPFGAFCLGLRDRYTPAELPKTQVLRILSNLEVVELAPLSRADRLILESCLLPVSNSVWKLDQSKMLDAVAQGQSVDQLQAFLKANSSEALPQTVTQFLSDLQNRATSLQDLGSARLIRCSDPALATLIANDSRTKAFCFLADQPKVMNSGQACYLAVPMVTETKFRNALKKLGYSLPN